MATQLADAVGIAADTLSDGRKAARKWLNGGREPNLDVSSAAAHAARLFNVIATAVVNCRSQHSRRSITQLVASIASGPYDLLPESFQEMLAALGSHIQPVPVPGVGQALQRALSASGDSLVVLYRPSSYELKKPLRWAEALPAVLVEDEVCVGFTFNSYAFMYVSQALLPGSAASQGGLRYRAQQLSSSQSWSKRADHCCELGRWRECPSSRWRSSACHRETRAGCVTRRCGTRRRPTAVRRSSRPRKRTTRATTARAWRSDVACSRCAQTLLMLVVCPCA